MNYIKVQNVDVVLDHGSQGQRYITGEAWAVIMQDDQWWPTKCLLLGIHMDRQAALDDRERFEGLGAHI